MMAIGIAVWSPAIPTIGAITAPEIMEKKPIKAEAPPATLPCACIAMEKLLVPIEAIVEIVTIKKTMTKAMDRSNQKAAKRAKLLIRACRRENRKIFQSGMRPVIRPTRMPVIIKAMPLAPKI